VTEYPPEREYLMITRAGSLLRSWRIERDTNISQLARVGRVSQRVIRGLENGDSVTFSHDLARAYSFLGGAVAPEPLELPEGLVDPASLHAGSSVSAGGLLVRFRILAALSASQVAALAHVEEDLVRALERGKRAEVTAELSKVYAQIAGHYTAEGVV
jgi:transcriptional regulator with XRE-family HTH domain